MKKISILFAILFLGGCATAYQPKGMTGGFSSTQLDTNVFTVTFKGNGFTDREKSNDYALLRCAEIALENGYDYFVIIDAQQYSKNSTYTTPTKATTKVNTNTYGSVYGYRSTATYNANTYGTATTTVTGGQTRNISKPRTSNSIVCFNERPQGFSYNAKFVSRSIKSKYGI